MDVHKREDGVGTRLSASPDGHDTDRAGLKSATTSTPNGIRSSPPVLDKDNAMDIDPGNSPVEDAGGKSDSEAETIVLPGKDGHSPSKIRKSIKHEDKSEDEDMPDVKDIQAAVEDGPQDKRKSIDSTSVPSALGKRKRQKHLNNQEDATHHGNSSGLSSVPTSPVTTTRSSLSKPAPSDSDVSKSPSPPVATSARVKDKAKSVDRALPRRKHRDTESGEEDDIEDRRSVRPRSGTKTNFDTKPGKVARSQSPQARTHRRSISTQLPGKHSHGLSHKKKRIPAPLQSTEYQSDESSGSQSSFPRSSRLRSLAAPNTGDSGISPVKMAHRKHVNPSGQTQFLRACGQNKLDVATQRYEERPEDLNVADHAGNTPLHAASLAGNVDVVKFLLAAPNCIVDPVNEAKDTPLHDALENGHTEVVKLLLDAGANPRTQKSDGKDALDIISEGEKEAIDDDDQDSLEMWTDMRKLVNSAIKKFVHPPQDSEEDRLQDNNGSRLSHSIDSPRHTPPIPNREFSNSSAGASRRVGVGSSRHVKTKDGNLYQPMTLDELRKAARDNDIDTTARILEIIGTVNDLRSAWLAARGGHHVVLNLHMAMGGFDPNSGPLLDVEPGKGTACLVAIGRNNSNHVEVIKLLVGHPDFDPTRLFDGETYYEIARKRKGPNWQEEVAIFKDAFDKYKPHKSSPSKPRSPGTRRDMREHDRDGRRPRKDDQPAPRSHKRKTSSPKIKDSEPHHQRHRRNSSIDHPKDGQHRRGPGRPRKDETIVSAALSDRDSSPVAPKSKSQPKRETETAVASDTEVVAKPRRKLISGKEFRGERDLEKQRRASIVSNTSSASLKDKRDRTEARLDKLEGRASPSIPRTSTKQSDHDLPTERHHEKDRPRSLHRDESKDRLAAVRGESPVKRPRNSETPPRSNGQDTSAGGAPKRRRLETESNRKGEGAQSSSPETHTTKLKSNLYKENIPGTSNTDADQKVRSSKIQADSSKEPRKKLIQSEQPLTRPNTSAKDSHPSTPESLGKPMKTPTTGLAEKSKEEMASLAKAKKEKDAEEARIKREEEEKDALRKMEEKAEAEKQEQERIEEARKARLAREQAAKEEEERREQEEVDRKEQQRIEEAEARARAAEQQRALYHEQERLKREEQERRRTLQQEQQRAEKARVEQVKREERLAKLPYLLRWFDMLEVTKTPGIAAMFNYIQGYRYDTIKPEQTGRPGAQEAWMLNSHVATLLGEKDLQLSRYTAWERISLNSDMKKAVWRTENDWFTLRNDSYPSELKRFFSSTSKPYEVEAENKILFLNLDLFFVKVSEFMYIVPNFPHLRGIEMVVKYKELWVPKPGEMLPVSKWKSDPDCDPNQTFWPLPKTYLNGTLCRERQRPHSQLTKNPPPENRVPRRGGIVQVFPGDSDYEEICKQQGLFHLLGQKPISPSSSKPGEPAQQPQQNGFTPPGSTSSINGHSPRLSNGGEIQKSVRPLPNGVSEHSGSPTDTSPPAH